jgi:hypothetical protein
VPGSTPCTARLTLPEKHTEITCIHFLCECQIHGFFPVMPCSGGPSTSSGSILLTVAGTRLLPILLPLQPLP